MTLFWRENVKLIDSDQIAIDYLQKEETAKLMPLNPQ